MSQTYNLKLTDVTQKAGISFLHSIGDKEMSARMGLAAACGQYTSWSSNFFDFDILVLNLNNHPRLLRNDGKNHGNWLMLHLVGGISNCDAIYLLARAIEKAGLNRAAIRDAIANTDYFSPVTGKIFWDNTGGRMIKSVLRKMVLSD